MTQRTLQLNQHGRSIVLLLVALNSIYTFFSTFEKALTDRERARWKYLVNCELSVNHKIKEKKTLLQVFF